MRQSVRGLFCVWCLLSGSAQAALVGFNKPISFQGTFSKNKLQIDRLDGPSIPHNLGPGHFGPQKITLDKVTFDGQFVSGLKNLIESATPHEGGNLNLKKISLLVETSIPNQSKASFTVTAKTFSNLNPESNQAKITNILKDLKKAIGHSVPAAVSFHGKISINKVPEIDAASGTIPIGLLLGILTLLSERQRRPYP
jgi:hypothetical protein